VQDDALGNAILLEALGLQVSDALSEAFGIAEALSAKGDSAGSITTSSMSYSLTWSVGTCVRYAGQRLRQKMLTYPPCAR